MNLDDFVFSLPRKFIAQYPPEDRGTSKLLVLDRKTGEIEHRMFAEIVDYFSPNDVLCINNTKVIPARLYGNKESTKGRVEVFLLNRFNGTLWNALLKPAKRLRPGVKIVFNEQIGCNIEERGRDGKWKIKFYPETLTEKDIFSLGEVPLPPYIKRKVERGDYDRYQTVYARRQGSVASPTAGLHFTERMLTRIERNGVKVIRMFLHIGLGTFRSVKTQDISLHKMDSEYYEINRKGAMAINAAKKNGSAVFAVGTSTTRALETACRDGEVMAESRWTEKFIYPPYKFKVIDHLITNFHLPRTTLLMLVSAFADRKLILNAYEEAKKQGYRFFSYGDAMLIL